MTKLNEMWAALAAYQPQADAAGHGKSWARMCGEKTVDAACAATAAAKFSNAADAADCAAYAVRSPDAAAEMWAQMAVNRINKAMEKNT
jgi:hypothetical protein